MQWRKIKLKLTKYVDRLRHSIAFYPALIVIFFLILSYLSVSFDFSEEGKRIKSQWEWLRLKDASTARIIASSIVGGIISLTVFSFSMVMIVLNQTASQMSNRILDNIIGSRFQQVVLGVYIGTVVYALLLMSLIRDIDSGITIPALSTYLLIAFSVLDLFFFVYFLHYITQAVKYEVIIRRIYKETKSAMYHSCLLRNTTPEIDMGEIKFSVLSEKTGVYEGFDKTVLLSLLTSNDYIIHIMNKPGTYVLKGIPILKINKQVSDSEASDFLSALFINSSESIKYNYLYGFRQLTEVALKALSPGIHDPGTAIISLRSLFSLYAKQLFCYAPNVVLDEKSKPCIVLQVHNFETIFEDTLLPVWNAGKHERMIRQELIVLITQLQLLKPTECAARLLQQLRIEVQKE